MITDINRVPYLAAALAALLARFVTQRLNTRFQGILALHFLAENSEPTTLLLGLVRMAGFGRGRKRILASSGESIPHRD